MRGSAVNQVHQIFSAIAKIGESKHDAKNEARELGAKTWHQVGKNIDVYSYKTLDDYQDIAIDAFKYIKENFNVKDITKIESQHINSYLESKIESNIKYSSFQKYAAACEKLEVALSKYTNKQYDFNISDTRELAQKVLERTDPHRAYSDPQKLVNAIQDKTYRVLAEAQLQGGFRIHELNHLKISQFSDSNHSVIVQGKGGKIREIELNEKVYSELKTIVEKSDNQKLVFNANSYRNELKSAAQATGQDYNGSHGLRWNFAQNLFKELQESGKTYEQSLFIVSHALGHNRADITEHYLR
jgi:integrase